MLYESVTNGVLKSEIFKYVWLFPQIQILFSSLWQNQLLAKGLLFIEEKLSVCEGKYRETLRRWALGSQRAL